MNKNLVKIICGMVAIIIVITVFVLKNKNGDNGGEWKIYKNDELNIETKLPEGVEVEINE